MPSGNANPPVKQVLTQAAQHLNAGRLPQAEHLLRQVLQTQPGNHEALNLLGAVALNSGHAAQAADIFARAVQLHGKEAEYHCNLGVALLSINRTGEGETALRAALELKPAHPMANFNLGLRELQTGQFESASKHLDKAVKKMPKNMAAVNALGVAYSKLDNPVKAAQLFRKVLNTIPNNFDAGLNLASALTETGRLDEAIAQFERMIDAHPNEARLHFNLGVALRKAKRASDAIREYEHTLELEPGFADAHVNLSNLQAEMGQFEDALEHAHIASQLRPEDIKLMVNEAKALQNPGLASQAERLCRSILERDPKNDQASGMLIRTMQNDGRFEEARAEAERILSIQPQAISVLNALSSDRSYEFSDLQISYMNEAMADEEDAAQAARAGFALAKIHHDRGETAKAFDYYHRANTMRDEEYAWTKEQEQYLFDAIINTYTPELFKSKRGLGSRSERPIFIVGMPRSGTTLTEQIIASHPDAEGAGELSEIAAITLNLASDLNSDSPYPAVIQELTAESAERMANRYLARLDKISQTARHVTDKMPDNYLHLGIIALLFPMAKIIHCRRDPMATCFSIYQQNFQGYHPYAYDLAKLGRRHRNHDRIMAHWHEVLPLRILEASYEELVQDQAGQSRRILEFCGLDWQDEVLKFHETDRSVQTASLWQVRQPIYTGAVKGWRKYEEYLEPLKEALEADDA